MAEKIFITPFAFQGDREVIPDATQPDGSVSFNQGFGFDYERPTDDPLYKPFPRDPYNWLMGVITEALGEIQVNGYALWKADGAPYAINTYVRHGETVYRSLSNANISVPGEVNAEWADVRKLSSEAAAGIIALASAADVISGINTGKAVTPAGLAALTSTDFRRGLIQLATAAEAQAFGVTNKAITPKTLADAFSGANQLFNVSAGYQKLAGGFIVQWRVASTVLGEKVEFVAPFPIAFPNGALCISALDSALPSAGAISWECSELNAGNCKLWWQWAGPATSTTTRQARIIALGW